MRYSSRYFGPNACPVQEFTDATIPAKTTISLMADYYFGFGDVTKNGFIKIEVPLLPERVSLKMWSTVLESYTTNESVSYDRFDSLNSYSGKATGDIYLQTRIRLTKENKILPSIIINSTLKTASGDDFEHRRYFDTPAYYFDAEVGKSVKTEGKFINKISTIANIGFLVLQTSKEQNDAPMYGVKIIIGNENWKLENTVSGYNGWMHKNTNHGFNYGDNPLTYNSKILIITSKINYFAQYQYGIRDFPYHQLRLGVSFTLNKLTPKYDKLYRK